jgi:pimeloyl-ACP methyl ester carboxylesterase
MSGSGLAAGLAVLAALYLVYGAVMVAVHPAFLYPFTQEPGRVPGFVRIEVEVPGSAPVAVLEGGPQDGPPLLFFMGNAGALGLFEPWLALHRDAGRRVVAMTYRGGGGEPGRPSEARLKADALAVHDWLRGGGRPVLLHGFSLGAGLALHVGARRQVAAVVLEAPFARACGIMARAAFLPACRLPVQKWDNLAEAGSVTAPVLVVHGAADEVIGVDEGRRLAEALARAGRLAGFEVVPGGRHGDLPFTPGYRLALERFLTAQAP